MTTKEQIKNTGATFTPKDLSIFLAERIASYVEHKTPKVLDPACGDGELLIAMNDILSCQRIECSLTGYDANAQYLNVAQTRMNALKKEKVQFIQGDFLDAITVTTANSYNPTLFEPDYKSQINNFFDIVIANPPYVRTQLLGTEQAQELSQKFNLKGRVDLYYPFLIAMTESLKEGGIVGVITSNRYLSTKSGESIRKFLSENYEILEVIDLGDTKLFNAAVLPAIFIGRKQKCKKTSNAKFIKIYENLNPSEESITQLESIFSILKDNQSGYFSVNGKNYKKSIGFLKYKIGEGACWEMLSSHESDWVSKINSSAKNRISDFFKVKVGIKSTADKVFISDSWDELGCNKPEEELLKELISQENIEPWNIKNNLKLKVLYPYSSTSEEKQPVDINKYPKAKNYFMLHEKKLKSRKYLIEAGRNWYELWVPHRPNQWKYPKIIFPDISLFPRFCFDEGGKIVNGNCYWILATTEQDIEKLLLIQGVANSKLMTKYHDLVFNNKLYSGRRRYFSQYVERYPLPDIESANAKDIVSLVKKLNQANDKKIILELEIELEKKVAEAFGVSPIFSLD